MPCIPRPRLSVSELIGVVLTKLATPISHSFVRQGHTTFCHQLFNISVTQAKTEIQPDTMADALCRKPMALVQVGCR